MRVVTAAALHYVSGERKLPNRGTPSPMPFTLRRSPCPSKFTQALTVLMMALGLLMLQLQAKLPDTAPIMMTAPPVPRSAAVADTRQASERVLCVYIGSADTSFLTAHNFAFFLTFGTRPAPEDTVFVLPTGLAEDFRSPCLPVCLLGCRVVTTIVMLVTDH